MNKGNEYKTKYAMQHKEKRLLTGTSNFARVENALFPGILMLFTSFLNNVTKKEWLRTSLNSIIELLHDSDKNYLTYRGLAMLYLHVPINKLIFPD